MWRWTWGGLRFSAGLILMLSIGFGVGRAETAHRPNILWLLTEDMSPNLSCYGTEQVWTPNLDRLAARGMRYTQAFTVTPVCSTSRSGFGTGMYPITIGAHQHRTLEEFKRPLPEGVKTLPQWFRDAGYWTANIKDSDVDLGTGKVDWNFKAPGKPFDGDKWDELKSHQPFYAQVNFTQSHRAFTAPKKADPAKVVLPPYYPDHPLARADWAAYLDEVTEVDGLVGRVLELLEKDGLASNTIVVMMGDHGMAHVRGKQWPYDSGLKVPLIIYIPEGIEKPQGYQPGKVEDRLVMSIDLTATTLALAGIKKPAKMQGQVFLGNQSEPPRAYTYASRDRCDMTSFRIRSVRGKRYRYIRNYMPERPFLQLNLYKERSYPMIALMRELHAQGRLTDVQAKLLAPKRPAEELYCIEEDPYEINNLVDSSDPKHQKVLARLRKALDEWIEDADDQGRFPEDPAIGLGIMEDVVSKSKPEQLDALEVAIEQQEATPGMDQGYLAYLKKVKGFVDARRANPSGNRKGKK